VTVSSQTAVSQTVNAQDLFNMDVLKDRDKQYGDFRENFQRIADLWTAHLGYPVTAHDVAWMMVLLKAARSKGNAQHQDNYLDAKGYVELAELLS
jgi:hypothetical protein